MHLVYPYRHVGEGSSECLRYSVRSACAAWQVAGVTVIGEAPGWFSGRSVAHGPGGSKYSNALERWRIASELDYDVEEIVLMNDDFFVLSQSCDPAEWQHSGSLRERAPTLAGEYRDVALRTIEWLERRGVSDPLDFGLHRPMSVDINYVRQVTSEVSAVGPILLRSAIGNLFRDRRVTGPARDRKASCLQQLSEVLAGADFFSVNDKASLVEAALAQLKVLFPAPSPFES